LTIRDIKPKSPTDKLRRDYTRDELERRIDAVEAAAVLGMTRNFVALALGYTSGSRPRTISLAQLLDLLDVDGYTETFLPRSKVPEYLLRQAEPARATKSTEAKLEISDDARKPTLVVGNAPELTQRLPRHSVQCAITSSPYWGMRVYDNPRDVTWADGDKCPYGFEQTPEGFIRHTVELLYLLRPAMAPSGSVWWNLMDTYNTRTPIRGNSREKLQAMGGDPDHALGWTEHEACRHSAGHMYLEDGEMASIPQRVAERASRIGYRLTSFITWNKNSTPEPVKCRVTRQAEYVIHLAVDRTPFFDKNAWQAQPARLGGPNDQESKAKLADVWTLPTANGSNGHGAEFPLALPARCIALTSHEGDVVLDPFVGSGTSALAAMELGRRFIGFDISRAYINTATARVAKGAATLALQAPHFEFPESTTPVNGKAVVNGQKHVARRRTTRLAGASESQ